MVIQAVPTNVYYADDSQVEAQPASSWHQVRDDWRQNREQRQQRRDNWKQNWNQDRDNWRQNRENREQWQQKRGNWRQAREQVRQAKERIIASYRQARADAIASFDERPVLQWSELTPEDLNAWFKENKGNNSVLSVPQGKAISLELNLANQYIALEGENPSQNPVLRIYAKKPILVTTFAHMFWIKYEGSAWVQLVDLLANGIRQSSLYWGHDKYGPMISIESASNAPEAHANTSEPQAPAVIFELPSNTSESTSNASESPADDTESATFIEILPENT